MASVINTNLASLMAQRNLTGAQSALATSVERLSSGLRINRAKDDAAGLGISEKIKTQVNSLNQGVRNANDAISMVQSAEGSLSEVSSILQRMKDLTVQARNDSLGPPSARLSPMSSWRLKTRSTRLPSVQALMTCRFLKMPCVPMQSPQLLPIRWPMAEPWLMAYRLPISRLKALTPVATPLLPATP